MALAGLRVGEACALSWRDVDLAGARLRVRESKTEAGERVVDLSPDLLSELKQHKAKTRFDGPDDPVFATARGTRRDRHTIRSRILQPTITAASALLVKRGASPIEPGTTNHTLRRTFASLLYEAGASPAYVMSQMGHTSSALALEVYAKKMQRQRDTGARMDALVRGADWARMGTIDGGDLSAVARAENTSVAKAAS
jgi:integrase